MRGWIVLCVVVLMAIAAFIAYNLLPRDSVSKASVNQTVVRFRKKTKRAASYPKHPGAHVPPFGVYRYSTRGSEGIESLFFTSGHKYGGVTTVTVTPTRCGVSERWQPLVERWIESELCLGPRTSRVVAVREFHEFFGKSKSVSYSCGGGGAPYPSKLRPEMSWTTRCTSASGTVISKVEVIDLEKIVVAGKPIDAVHLRSSVRLHGDPDGTDTRDSWVRRSDGLLLRKTDNSKAHIRVAGGGEYDEHYKIDLISTKPQR